MLQRCKLNIVPGIIPVTLPSNFRQIKPTEFKYSFALEVQVISEIEEERCQEQREKEEEQRIQKERDLQAQAKAWDLVLNRRSAALPSAVPRTRNSDSLIDLDFAEPQAPPPSTSMVSNGGNGFGYPDIGGHSEGGGYPDISGYSTTYNFSNGHSPQSSPSPINQPHGRSNGHSEKAQQLIAQFSEMGPDVIEMGIDIFGADDAEKVINFAVDFQRFRDEPENFDGRLIKHALALFGQNLSGALDFLRSSDRIMKQRRSSPEEFLEASEYFSNDLANVDNYLRAFGELKEFGFSKEVMRDAIIVNGNDTEKAVQYLLESS